VGGFPPLPTFIVRSISTFESMAGMFSRPQLFEKGDQFRNELWRNLGALTEKVAAPVRDAGNVVGHIILKTPDLWR